MIKPSREHAIIPAPCRERDSGGGDGRQARYRLVPLMARCTSSVPCAGPAAAVTGPAGS
jgi:hypothetical protein